MEFPQTLQIELPYDRTLPLLSSYVKERKTLFQKDVCAPMINLAVFTVARQQSDLSVHPGEWMKKT